LNASVGDFLVASSAKLEINIEATAAETGAAKAK
jgi:hypothetical protein